MPGTSQSQGVTVLRQSPLAPPLMSCSNGGGSGVSSTNGRATNGGGSNVGGSSAGGGVVRFL